jgi:N-acetylmuramic acid 6-phosphate etherase
MSELSNKRSDEFLRISNQFQLGALTTELSHPVTSNLSSVAESDVSKALLLLFRVDQDVVDTYKAFAGSGRALQIASELVKVLKIGGKIFFTGCGSTGRLSIQLVSIWRDFWQRQSSLGLAWSSTVAEWEQRAFSVMAGGDYALIKSVEGFEDFTAFGKKQLADLGVSARDVVFAITEGGETSFVIGTAWQGIEVGAKVYFVYNNPDDVLCRTVQHSREVIEDPRIEKVNLTTGPMAITGSTRMQATTIQLCVLVTILEMVARDLLRELEPNRHRELEPAVVPDQFLRHLKQLLEMLKSQALRTRLAKLVTLEEATYRAGHKNNYFADQFGIDVLTDTTERSPTYCTPPFRKFDDHTAAESWAFLFVPAAESSEAWKQVIKRKPACVEWSPETVRGLVGEHKYASAIETIRKISYPELMRFKIGQDGLKYRPLMHGDLAVGVVSQNELPSLLQPSGFHRNLLERASKAGSRIAVVFFGGCDSIPELAKFVSEWGCPAENVLVEVPKTDFLLDGITRVGVKMLLNALSTCTMVRLGRVMGNYMIWVVPSNLKLIDRATRYIQNLSSLSYSEANRLLFEVIEYVEPRMMADQKYPPVVGVSVLRARYKIPNEEAERRLLEGLR